MFTFRLYSHRFFYVSYGFGILSIGFPRITPQCGQVDEVETTETA